jgi:soluble lytic murein transglycosylase-like protein
MSDEASFKSYANNEANAYGIPPDIFSNLIDTESSWNPNAVSTKGAEGIAQLMPGTAPGINRFDPFASLTYAAKLLRSYFDKFGSWNLAVAAYNAGPHAVEEHGNTIPPYAETVAYVSKIVTPTALASGEKKTPIPLHRPT